MRPLFYINILLFTLFTRINSAENVIETDWDATLTKLSSQLAIWNSKNINTYVYSQQRWACECLECTTVKQYVTVINDVVFNIEYSQINNWANCSTPYIWDYQTINDWFSYAIQNANSSRNRCGTNGKSLYCDDVSFEITYDDTYGFPIQIVIDRAAMAYDGGSGIDFDCFDGYKNGMKLGTANTTQCDYESDIDFKNMSNIISTTSEISTTTEPSLPYNCHQCLTLNDGCNDCECSYEGYIACTEMACLDSKDNLIEYEEKTCKQCIEDELYWLVSPKCDIDVYDCDGNGVSVTCVNDEYVSTCRCPTGYSFHKASNGDKGCILTDNCPFRVGGQLTAISDDILFSYTTESDNGCGYDYKICQWDNECEDGFECILADDPYDSDNCIKLYCDLDVDCNKINCSEDCLGSGFGICTPDEQDIVQPVSRSSVDNIHVVMVLSIISFFIYI